MKSKAKRAVQGKQVKQAKKKQKNSKKTNTKKLLAAAAARKVFCGYFRFLRCFCSFTVVAKSFPIFPFSFSFSLHASTGCTASAAKRSNLSEASSVLNFPRASEFENETESGRWDRERERGRERGRVGKGKKRGRGREREKEGEQKRERESKSE